MRNFLLKIFIFFVLTLIVLTTTGELLKHVRTKNTIYYPEIRWNDFYSQEINSINLIFLGSSHCARSFNPFLFDSEFNINSFNMGSAAQSLVTSYYVLKEILKSQKPKYLILEVHHTPFRIQENYANAIHNFDYINSFDVKINFFFNGFQFKDYIKVLLTAYRLNNFLQYLSLSDKKQKLDKNKSSNYSNKGYIETKISQELKNVNHKFGKEKIDLNKFTETQICFFYKIIKCCKKNSIDLIFVTQTYNTNFYDNLINYNEMHSFFDSISKENKIPYFDFNEPEYHAKFKPGDFYDWGHLNSRGVLKFNQFVIDKIKGQGLIFKKCE